jgi:S-adenosylmethionine synthetase
VVLAGEISSRTNVDYEAVARQAIREIGYVDAAEAFNADGVRVTQFISKQSGDIAMGVDTGGAGDQGIMFGYATDETPELMPLPVQLAHRLSQRLTTARKTGERMWLRPDTKTQVSVRYEDNAPVRVDTVLVSAQHSANASQREIRDYVAGCLTPEVLGEWFGPHVEILVNPTGQFIEGGPSADCGVTGRKIIVDTYGGFARHGGGAFSGKDPSKVDRSAAYAARYVAKNLVAAGLADRAEVQVAYAIGMARPMSVLVETYRTEHVPVSVIRALVDRHFDLRPGAFREYLKLHRPGYLPTAAYGHFGRDEAGFTWEQTDRAELLRADAGLA